MMNSIVIWFKLGNNLKSIGLNKLLLLLFALFLFLY